MKLFALHGAGFDPLSHLLQLVLPVPVWHSQAWAKRWPCGLRVMGHCPLGTPCSAGGVAATAGRAGAALLLCWLHYSEINARY